MLEIGGKPDSEILGTDEKKKLSQHPDVGKTELYHMFLRDGWSRNFASKMARSASMNRPTKAIITTG